MQCCETADVHPGLSIEDHGQGPPFGFVDLAVDEPKGGPCRGRVTAGLAEHLHMRLYVDRHVRVYADNRGPSAAASTRIRTGSRGADGGRPTPARTGCGICSPPTTWAGTGSTGT
ncbi:hypothetical protein RAJCM14343_1681 [Rhodococcus aetherivorans]|uniref:Uncharacterized protein n=1 Tax=Rhodococcus aetherivorans TaxID=191292 RepID=A0ABQ0YIQ2_9NOCA|nr:hypothetical protein RAJCM14343_1681 [Rhodococcus aetherivorans]